MKQLRLNILKAHDEPVLAGRLSGKRLFLRLLGEMPPVTEPILVLLDFRAVQVATASFLSEAVIPFRDHLNSRRPAAYVVLGNVADTVEEELEGLLQRTGDAILSCRLSPQGKISHVQLLGALDAKLLETFKLIKSKGETSAVELHNDSSESSGIGPTAWNNRLAALASKSLVIEIPHGRTKKYRPVLEIN